MTPIKKVLCAIDLTKARVRSETGAAERGVAAADCSAGPPIEERRDDPSDAS